MTLSLKKPSESKAADKYLLTVLVLFCFLFPGPLTAGERSVHFTEEWSLNFDEEIFSSPAYGNGLLVFGTEAVNEGEVVAVDANDGEVVWKFNTKEMVRSSPAIVGDSIFIGSETHGVPDDPTGRGTLHALNLSDGSLAWQQQFDHLGFASPYPWRELLFYTAGVVKAFDPAGGETVWSYDPPGDATSSPVVADGILYFGTSDPSYVIALDAENGSLKWKTPVEYFVESSPAVYEDVLYIGDWQRTFYALDARTGELLWQDKYEHPESPTGILSSPLAASGLVFYGNFDGRAVARRADDGTKVWQHKFDHPWHSSPALAEADDLLFWPNYGKRYTADPPAYLYAFDPETGDELGRVETRTNVSASPLVKDGRVYVATSEGGRGGQGALKAFSYRVLEKKELDLHGAAEFPARNLQLTDEKLIISGPHGLRVAPLDGDTTYWQFKPKYGEVSYFAATDQDLLMGSYDGRVRLFDLETGEKRWSQKLLAGPLRQEPLFYADLIFFVQERGQLLAVRRLSGELVWERELDYSPRGLARFDDQGVYVTREGLFCYFDLSTGQDERCLEAYDGYSGLTAYDDLLYLHGGRKFYAADPETEESPWSYQHNFGLAAEPLITEERIYFSDWAGYVHALDRKTGEQLWRRFIGRAARAQPQIRGNLLWLANLSGEVYALDRAAGEKIYSFTIDASLTDLQLLDGRKILLAAVGRETRGYRYYPGWPGYAGRGSEQLQRSSSPGRPEDSLAVLQPDTVAFAPLASGRHLFIFDGTDILAYRVLKRPAETTFFLGNRRRTGNFAAPSSGWRLEKMWRRDPGEKPVRQPLLTPELLIVGTPDALIAYCRTGGREVWRWRPNYDLSDYILSPQQELIYVTLASGEIGEVSFDFGFQTLLYSGTRKNPQFYSTDEFLIAVSGQGKITTWDITGRAPWAARPREYSDRSGDSNSINSAKPVRQSEVVDDDSILRYGRGRLFKFTTAVENHRVPDAAAAAESFFYPDLSESGEPLIREFDLRDGSTRNKFSLPVQAEEYRLAVDEKRLYVFLNLKAPPRFLVYSRDDGEKLWSDEQRDFQPAGLPVLHGETLLQQGVDRHLQARLYYRKASTGEVLDDYLLKDEVHEPLPGFSPTLAPPYLYIPTADNHLRSYELKPAPN